MERYEQLTSLQEPASPKHEGVDRAKAGMSRIVVAAAVVALASLPPTAWAQGTDQKPAPKPPSTYDKIWGNVTDWYDDKSNPVVQRVVFTGRAQHDFAMVNADQGDHD